jgi:hypothetical protein
MFICVAQKRRKWVIVTQKLHFSKYTNASDYNSALWQKVVNRPFEMNICLYVREKG